MGHVDAARVDVAELLRIAGGFDALSDLIGPVIARGPSAFGGATAGRAHAHHGDAVRLALEDLSHPVSQWVRAVHEIASALRTSSAHYIAADAYASHRMG